MKKVYIGIFLLFCFSYNWASAQYEIMVSDNYPPYNFLNEDGQLVGFNIDIINAINEIFEPDLKISSGNWNDINKALAEGKIQGIAGIHYPSIVDDQFYYTRSVINTSHCFLYNSNHIKNFNLEVLRTTNHPLVVLWKNDVLTHYILSINPTAHFIYAANYKEILEALDNDEVTCAFTHRIAGIYHAVQYGKNYIYSTENKVLERNMGFKVSKGSKELMETLDNGIEIIMSNGKYQEIYDKWIKDYNKNRNFWHYYSKYILVSGIFILGLILVLLLTNKILQDRVRAKTKDLQDQLTLNSRIMSELEEQKIKAEESDRMKSAFLANMSHEIRTPMNGILGFTELLKSQDYTNDEQSMFINLIQQSGERMLATINNIIDISKIESGNETIKIGDVNIVTMMQDLENFFIPETKTKGIKLSFQKNGRNSYPNFYTDSYKLNAILINLIKNAIKFTKKGSVTVHYSYDAENANFSVTDTGIGIPLDKQQAIFDHFVQADFSHSNGYEGSGLGLSISKGYATMLNGDLWVESEINKGSKFFVKIPNAEKPE